MRSQLPPFFRTAIGFDRLFDEIERLNDAESAYPPYNIERDGENAYRLTLAVAGFSLDELSVNAEGDTLTVSGERKADEAREFLHRGIAGRGFERRFQLAEHVKVPGARLENGLLSVELVREVPEAAKPRTVEIRVPEEAAKAA